MIVFISLHNFMNLYMLACLPRGMQVGIFIDKNASIYIRNGEVIVVSKDKLVITDCDIVYLTFADKKTGEFLLSLVIDVRSGDIIDHDYDQKKQNIIRERIKIFIE